MQVLKHSMSGKGVLLCLIPVTAIIIGWKFLSQIFPVYAGAIYDQDPAYVYLYSGLTMLNGHVPQHTDHPGTPLQLLSGLVELSQWLFYRAAGLTDQDLTSAVLAHSETYIYALSWVLLVLNACAIYYFGRRVLQTTHSIVSALFVQAAPLVYGVTDPRIAYLSPEALLIFSSLCLLGLLAPIILGTPKNKDDLAPRISPWAGALCGFAVAVKVTFIPMAGLLYLLGSRRELYRSFKYMVLTFVICILPIASRVKTQIEWYHSLATHTGNYGAGDPGIIDVSAIPARMADLLGAFPFLYIVAAMLAAVLALQAARKVTHRSANSSGSSMGSGVPMHAGENIAGSGIESRVPFVLLAIIIIQTVLVIKHPGPHYMLPALPLAFAGALWMVRSGNVMMLSSASVRWLQIGLLGLALGLSASAFSSAFDSLHAERLRQDESLAPIQKELGKYPDALVIGTYRCTLPECAISFGQMYSPKLENKLAPILSHFILYNIWDEKHRLVVYGKGGVPLQQVNDYLAAHRDIFLVSPDYPQLAVFKLKEIIKTPTQSLYRVTGLAESNQ